MGLVEEMLVKQGGGQASALAFRVTLRPKEVANTPRGGRAGIPCLYGCAVVGYVEVDVVKLVGVIDETRVEIGQACTHGLGAGLRHKGVGRFAFQFTINAQILVDTISRHVIGNFFPAVVNAGVGHAQIGFLGDGEGTGIDHAFETVAHGRIGYHVDHGINVGIVFARRLCDDFHFTDLRGMEALQVAFVA